MSFRRWRPLRIENARIEAFRLQRRYGVETPGHLHVESFAAALGIKLVDARLDGAAAQLLVRTGRPRIVVSDRLTDPAERRFAIAHELGHFVLRHPAPPAADLCSPRPRNPFAQRYDDDDRDARDLEAEADTFASELLMPGEIVRTVCNAMPMTLDAPTELARICGVTLAASAVRITDQTCRICAAVLSVNGRVQWSSPSLRFLQRLGMALPSGSQLDPRSVAASSFEAVEQPLRLGPSLVPISAWCDAPEDMYFEEDATRTSQPGTVLSMLWLSSDRPRVRYKRNTAVILGRAEPRTGSMRSAGLSEAKHSGRASVDLGERAVQHIPTEY